jgi:uncharacterized protein YjbI with pentapeptide repeats
MSDDLIKKEDINNNNIIQYIRQFDESSKIDLSFTCLSDANLRGANLIGANLRGSDLSGAILNKTYFNGVYLYSKKEVKHELLQI